MTFSVRMTNAAHRDLDNCYAYIAKSSPRGALAWVSAFQRKVLDVLLTDPLACGIAPENSDHLVEIRQTFFRTRQGRNYRAIFTIKGLVVFVLHIRGPGQDLIPPGEFELS